MAGTVANCPIIDTMLADVESQNHEEACFRGAIATATMAASFVWR